MAGTMQATKNNISLKGSTEIVAEFFMYGINNILYQRGIYPPETFSRVQKYGLTILVTTDEQIKSYLANILNQVKEWLTNMTVQKLVLVIRAIDTNEVLERWQFDVECDKTVDENSSSDIGKDEKQIQKEICAVIRQITAAVTILPMIESKCAFEILVYTDKDMDVPNTWTESGPALICNSQEVKFRSFSTNIHKVDSMVAFKAD